MNLLDAWHALAADFSQDTRLIQLHVGRGLDPEREACTLIAERLEVREAIAPACKPKASDRAVARAGTRLVVHALAADATLDLSAMRFRPARVELQAQHGARPWHGHVSEAAMLGSDGGLTRYRLVIEPWLAFAAHAQDQRKFKNASVPEILDQVFSRYRGIAAFDPTWRFDLAKPEGYPIRGDCSQYQESDLDFVQRLMREEGLFYWFEHRADAESDRLGSHELVIADHNGAFRPDQQSRVRYAQAHVVLPEDGITRWRRTVHSRASSIELLSPDRRSGAVRTVAQGANAPAGFELHAGVGHRDLPGVYAYSTTAHGEQIALRQIQALDARREEFSALSTVRTTAPGRTFTLTDHPVHRGDDAARDHFVVLGAHHLARSNLSAGFQAGIDARLGPLSALQPARPANSTDEPVYSCRVDLQRVCVPVRPSLRDTRGEPDPRLHPRPRACGVQTAIVVSTGGPIDSDRDHHVKVRHHWQRGTQATHRLVALDGDNAPGADGFASVLPVAEVVAGANWGSHFIKRAGQEVVVAHLQGQPDRGVILGSVYNGRGRENASGNAVLAAAEGATANAPAWFPGDATHGPWQGHRHAAVLTGFKTQEIATSRVGGGSGSAFVFCDAPNESRIELGTTTAAARVQLGNLGHLQGNELLESQGSGINVETTAWGALRAGTGLLLSAHGKPGTIEGGQQLEGGESLRRLHQASDRVRALAQGAQRQNATAPGDSDSASAQSSQAEHQLPAERGLRVTSRSLGVTDSRGEPSGGSASGQTRKSDAAQSSEPSEVIQGGGGAVTSWGEPHLVVAAPGGIAAFTPANTLVCSGEGISLVASHVQHLAQGDHASAIGQGLVLFTQGRNADTNMPIAQVGIRLHAARGSVRTESRTGATRLTAAGDLTVASAEASVHVAAPLHVLLTAAGAALQIDSSGITLKGPGKLELKAAMKEFSGPASASAAVDIPRPGKLGVCRYRVAGAPDGIEPL